MMYVGRRTCSPGRLAWSEGQRPSGTGAGLHSSDEPGELSQWLSRDDSTINVVHVLLLLLLLLLVDYFIAAEYCRCINKTMWWCAGPDAVASESTDKQLEQRRSWTAACRSLQTKVYVCWCSKPLQRQCSSAIWWCLNKQCSFVIAFEVVKVLAVML